MHVRIKADLTCAAVAGASVLAKTERDRLLVELSPLHPRYGFARTRVTAPRSTWRRCASTVRQHGASAQLAAGPAAEPDLFCESDDDDCWSGLRARG